MTNEFGIKIISPSATHDSCRLKSVTVPGSQGYMTILPGHADMVAELGVGELLVEASSSEKKPYFVSGGFVEVLGDEVIVLADIVEAPGAIDVAAAEGEKVRVLKQLSGKSAESPELLAKALKEAEYRIKIAKA